ncbi:hypothetical protein [Methyloceanibacter sp.]|uniref:hypothetical protein n=1 Tax=Methyloceanibacter sp. TaxID=1965321 RepID=UPI003D6D6E69
MSRFINGLLTWSAACAFTLLLFFALPLAAAPADKDSAPPEKGVAPEASEPKNADKSKGESKPEEAPPPDVKPEEARPPDAKTEEAPPPDAKAEEAPPAAGGIQSAVKMKDILAQGFLIRTTVFIPADAVTRHVGEVSPDAVLLTLQKETAIAVCYYTLKAYVNKKDLTDIASCTVYR